MRAKFKLNIITVALSGFFFHQTVMAGIVSDRIDYQYFRDLAENKGAFSRGASNILIYDNNGNFLNNFLPPDQGTMLDFASNSVTGTATLLDPQYVASVKHNVGVHNARFGAIGEHQDNPSFDYLFINRHQKGKQENQGKFGGTDDFMTPRLSRLVTETAPANIYPLKNEEKIDFSKKDRFTFFLRRGSGKQSQYDVAENGKVTENTLKEAYQYLTGGLLPKRVGDFDYGLAQQQTGWFFNWDINQSDQGKANDPLTVISDGGDSGSGIFVYDKEQKKWFFVSVLVRNTVENKSVGEGSSTKFEKKVSMQGAKVDLNFFNKEVKEKYTNKTLNSESSNNQFILTQSGNQLTITKKNNSLGETMTVFTEDHRKKRQEYNKNWQCQNSHYYQNGVCHFDNNFEAKNLTFTGQDGNLILGSDIDQDAGGLYFDTNFTVKNKDDTNHTYTGAGVVVAENKAVTWEIPLSKANDRLSKIGKGTLKLHTKFSKDEKLGRISVGDGEVHLDFQPKNGGTGKADAQIDIVSGRPTVKVLNKDTIDPNKIYFGFRGGKLDLNGNDLIFDRIKHIDSGATIINSNQNTPATLTIKQQNPWELNYSSKNRINREIKPYNGDAKSLAGYFEGFFGDRDNKNERGTLNLRIEPSSLFNETDVRTIFFTGGANAGNVQIERGHLILQGAPTPHAHQVLKNSTSSTVAETVYDDDYQNPNFTFKNVTVTDSTTFAVGRNVSKLTVQTIDVKKGAIANLGYTKGDKAFISNRYYGGSRDNTKTFTPQGFNAMPQTKIQGDLIANGTVKFGSKADYNGVVKGNGTIKLDHGSIVTFTNGSNFTGNISENNAPDKLNEKTKSAYFGDDSKTSPFFKWQRKDPAHNKDMKQDVDTVKLERSHLTLKDNVKWTVKQSTTIGDLTLASGSTLTLNPAFETVTQDVESRASGQNATKFNTLTVQDFKGNGGTVQFLSNVATNHGDTIIVKGNASGTANFEIKDQGAEPNEKNLTLMTVGGKNDLTATLNKIWDKSGTRTGTKGTIDLGAYRYELKKEDKNFNLKKVSKPENETQNEQNMATNSRTDSTQSQSPKTEDQNGKKITAGGQNPEQKDGISRYTNAAISASQVNLNTLLIADNNSDLSSKQPSRLWVSAEHSSHFITYQSRNHRDFSNYVALQNLKTAYTFYGVTLGGDLSVIIGNSRFADGIKANSSHSKASVFAKIPLPLGFRVSGGLGVTYAQNRIDNTMVSQVIPSVAVSVGKTFSLLGLYVDLDGEVRYYQLPTQNYTYKDAKISQKSTALIGYQAKTALGYGFDFASFVLNGSVFADFSGFANAPKVVVNGHQFDNDFGMQARIGIKAVARFGALGLNLNGGVAMGKNIKASPFAGATISYKW